MLAASSGGLLAIGATLSGCAGSGKTVFYTLDQHPPTSTGTDSGYRGPPIQVDSVQVPAFLDRSELIRRTGPDTMQIDDFARWAAPVGDLARRALTEDLAARLPPGAVAYPGAPRPVHSAGITVDMLDFSVDNGAGHLDVSWTLDQPDKAGTHSSPSTYTLHLSVPESDTGSPGTADAISRLLAALADAITQNLGQELGTP